MRRSSTPSHDDQLLEVIIPTTAGCAISWLSVGEAASYLRCTRSVVYEMLRESRIPGAYRMPNGLRMHRIPLRPGGGFAILAYPAALALTQAA